MKVLQINSVCGAGSTGRILSDLYRYLEGQGHECLIGYGRGTSPKSIKTIKIGTNLDNYMHVARTRLFDTHGFGSTKATKEFIRKVEEYNPDIIHLHNIHGYYINIKILFDYLEKSNKPIVWTLHDCWSFTGHCSHFIFGNCDKWKTGCYNCQLKREYPSSFIKDNSKENYMLKKELFNILKKLNIVSVSNWLNSVVEVSLLKNNEKYVIYNGIDTNIFKYSPGKELSNYGIQNKYVILGVASKWNNRKGFDRFLELSNYLKIDEVIVLVGVTSSQIKKLPKNIIGIKNTNSIQNLIAIYSEADVFVNMSYEETFGLVTAEALACGTPCVVFNSTANPELITNEVGRIVKRGKIKSIYKQICSLRELGKPYFLDNCQRHIRLNFSKKVMHERYMKLYNKVYDNNKTRGEI